MNDCENPAARLSAISLCTKQSLYVDTPAKLDHSGNDCYFLLEIHNLIVYNYYIDRVDSGRISIRP